MLTAYLLFTKDIEKTKQNLLELNQFVLFRYLIIENEKCKLFTGLNGQKVTFFTHLF